MGFFINTIVKCPVCSEKLVKIDRNYKCVNNHSFDLSKEGYVNLILNNRKYSGDSKEMMNSRRNFLNKGYYLGISNFLNKLIIEDINKDKKLEDVISIVDIGCGEGYYLSNLYKNLDDLYIKDGGKNKIFNFYGLDISKIGMKLAAKRNPNINFIVANYMELPFIDKSVDYVISMFADSNEDEVKRILKNHGKVIIIRSNPNHLIELKNIIYDRLILKENSDSTIHYKDFIIDKENYEYKVNIEGKEDLLELLSMTPHYWKIKKDGLERLNTYESLEITVNIDAFILGRETRNE